MPSWAFNSLRLKPWEVHLSAKRHESSYMKGGWVTGRRARKNFARPSWLAIPTPWHSDCENWASKRKSNARERHNRPVSWRRSSRRQIFERCLIDIAVSWSSGRPRQVGYRWKAFFLGDRRRSIAQYWSERARSRSHCASGKSILSAAPSRWKSLGQRRGPWSNVTIWSHVRKTFCPSGPAEMYVV